MKTKFTLSKLFVLIVASLLYFCGTEIVYGTDPSDNCPDNMLFLLRLDESSGPTYDDYLGVHNGTASSSPVATAGIVNGAQLFNINTKINIPNISDEFDWGSWGSFSMECWVKTSVASGMAVISRHRTDQPTEPIASWWIGTDDNGYPVMETRDNWSHNCVVKANFNIADNQWHHLVGIRDGAQDRNTLYVDNVIVMERVGFGISADFAMPTSIPVTIGYMLREYVESPEYHFIGSIDEAAVYSRALTADEVASFYNNGNPVSHCSSTYKTVIISKPVTTATEDVTYSYTFTVNGQDGDTLTLSSVTKPAWLNFNWTPGQKSAVLTGTPGNGNTGTANVTLSVNDGDSILYQSFSINVAAVNDIPVITGQRTITLNEDTKITISNVDLTITDVDNPPSDITLEVLAGTHYTFADNLVTPDANYNGPLYVNVIAKDLVGQSLAYPVLITVLPVNDAPVISTTPQLMADINHIYVYNMLSDDADNDDLIITLTGKPDWLNFTHGFISANLSGTPHIADIGSYPMVLSVDDGTVKVDQSFTIVVAQINDLPVITGQNSLSVNEDNSITLYKSDLIITDEDNPYTDLTLNVLAGDYYTHIGNIITPEANFNGMLLVNVAASDLAGPGPVYQAAITVNPVNDVSVITSNPVLSAQTKNLYSYQMIVSDVDASDVLTLSAVSKPIWLNFTWTPGQKTAILSGTPASQNIGTANVTLRVNDGHGNVDQSFSIVVVSGTNEVPVITGQSELNINEDTQITLNKSDLTITDSDNPSSDLTLQVLAGTNYTFTGNMVTPDANFNGPLNVNVAVKDLIGQSQTYPVLITVLPVNDAPVITTNPSLTAVVGQTYLYAMIATDADQDALTFTATNKPDWLSFTPGTNSAILSGIPTIADIGSYAIIITVNDGHSQIIKGFAITVSETTGIKETDNNILNLVYPNPANDKVSFKFANTGSSIIEIYDVTGGLLNQTRSDNNNLIEIDIADLPKGIYLYKVYQDNKISTGKIVRN